MATFTSVVLVIALIAGIGFLYLRGDLNRLICDGACPPQYATAPESMRTAAANAAEAEAVGEGAIGSTALKQAVAGPLAHPALGPRVGFAAVDARDGAPLAGGGTEGLIPASTTKVLTAFAALEVLGPDERFATRVVRSGDTLTLIGGGDPYLVERRPADPPPVVTADLATLADRVARDVGTGRFALTYDAELFRGPSVSPAWEDGYVPSVVAPISALWIDQGRGAGGDPARAAADAFARLLRERGVEVADPARAAAAEGATEVATVRSAPVATIVADLLRTSNNETSEVMFRHIARAVGLDASFEGGAAAVRQTLEQDAISTEGLDLHDGSGLSRRNRISPTTLVQTLVAASRDDRTTATLSGLPVGGFDGTVRSRFEQAPAGLGWVRAKTGTLTGVHSLAGIATLPGGRPVAFAVMVDDTEGINPLETQRALDSVAAAIAGCAC
ncbi:D-alanyl-D-alanine carboxypeptidase/D-alanyl-D-alanine-endopeptidase [Aeromicrobium phragmitis]|uniref:D-alanyl-D-alanine carboxypeptidase/D-alanyl-D-alanine-endopeptidase n=2 Tax=Aeromicrobium phragmitis TaxID=2478914 RepID=A0A3L8PII0_9ACTN|nr:D-alanyl-D-alanine carboxypeptidase/D-alanyl-D-alanine-endopeptidase [Aeromicrobium phragmitis]